MQDISEGKGEAGTAPESIGKAIRIDDARGRYVQFLKNVFPKERTLDGIKVVVDCAHGAAYHCAPQVFEELGADVIALGTRAQRPQHQRRRSARSTPRTWPRRCGRRARSSASRSTATPTA